jgi:hypothetical protein
MYEGMTLRGLAALVREAKRSAEIEAVYAELQRRVQARIPLDGDATGISGSTSSVPETEGVP